jgi:hypothetical protein
MESRGQTLDTQACVVGPVALMPDPGLSMAPTSRQGPSFTM